MIRYLTKSALLGGIALVAAGMAPASADTITKQTTVTQKEIPSTNRIDFSSMDLNHDGILSRSEVGRRLFFVFDSDGNQVIDNLEFKREKVLTVIPLEKKELTMVDFDDDGTPDVTNYTSDDFTRFSMLNRFDKNNNGLSAAEFIETPFLQLDTDRSSVIELSEWRDAYIRNTRPITARQYRYNN